MSLEEIRQKETEGLVNIGGGWMDPQSFAEFRQNILKRVQQNPDFKPAQKDLDNAANDIDLAISFGGLSQSQRVIDIACGHGRHTLEMLKRGFPRVTSLDIRHSGLGIMKTRAVETGFSIQPMVGDFDHLPLGNQLIDTALLFYIDIGTSEEARREPLTFVEVNRILNPGGRFLFHLGNGDITINQHTINGQLSSVVKEEECTLPNGQIGIQRVTSWLEMNSQTNCIRQEFLADGEITRRQYKEYQFSTLDQYKQMLSSAGLTFEKISYLKPGWNLALCLATKP